MYTACSHVVKVSRLDTCVFFLLLFYFLFFLPLTKVMPVLTTTYPLINSTFNVSQHTLRLIQEKMSDAAVTCDQILNENKPWQELFKVCSVRISDPAGNQIYLGN